MLAVEAAQRDEAAEAAVRFDVDFDVEAIAIAVVAGEEERRAAARAAVQRPIGMRDRAERGENDERFHPTSIRPAVVTAVPGASSCAARIATPGSSGSSRLRR